MSARMILDGDIRKLAKKMEKRGYRFEMGKKNHFRIFDPAGDHVGSLCGSPGTPRWELATLRTLARRGGLKV
jgi:hypothetical protein